MHVKLYVQLVKQIMYCLQADFTLLLQLFVHHKIVSYAISNM